jgi:Ala-tRNA(Pro) deacylase
LDEDVYLNNLIKEDTMPVQRLKEFLDSQHIKYVTIIHSPAYTSLEIAASAHIPGHALAKTTIVKIDNKLAMAVLPASAMVDLDRLREITGAKWVTVADEYEFKSLFPGCEIGAMPPFGNLYNLDVYVSNELTREQDIAFNAGSHTELIKMSFQDFNRLVQPKIAQYALL